MPVLYQVYALPAAVLLLVPTGTVLSYEPPFKGLTLLSSSGVNASRLGKFQGGGGMSRRRGGGFPPTPEVTIFFDQLEGKVERGCQ